MIKKMPADRPSSVQDSGQLDSELSETAYSFDLALSRTAVSHGKNKMSVD